MADIDKGLPNTRNKLEIPSEEELQDVAVQEPVEEKGPIEVIPEEDGGVTLDYEQVQSTYQEQNHILTI